MRCLFLFCFLQILAFSIFAESMFVMHESEQAIRIKSERQDDFDKRFLDIMLLANSGGADDGKRIYDSFKKGAKQE